MARGRRSSVIVLSSQRGDYICIQDASPLRGIYNLFRFLASLLSSRILGLLQTTRSMMGRGECA